jgi:hypothetical protein
MVVILGWFPLQDYLGGAQYTDFPDETLPLLLENVPLYVCKGMWFQHYSATPLFAHRVRSWIDNYFLDRWIGREGPITWPPPSPNLTPLDFYLWGCITEKIYATMFGIATI